MTRRGALLVLDDLRDLRTTFDLVIGDFGREAATRYMAILAEEERRFLARMLATKDLGFFDEYRRIMFGHVGDLAFVKAEMIGQTWAATGHMTDDVLVAVKEHRVPPEVVARLACVIHDEALLAYKRDHGRVRVVLPCNALSETIEEATRLASNDEDIRAAARTVGYELLAGGAPPRLSAHGVVHSALAELGRTGMLDGRPYVVLGAGMAREQYSRLGRPCGMEVVPLTPIHQSIVDQAVVACIDGTEESLSRARDEIERAILSPLRRSHPGLVVLEACTDFDFGLGLDAVRLMAQHMVNDCYLSSDATGR